MLRLSNADDLREDLELAVLELRDRGVAASSIRRYVNAAIRASAAGEDADGYIATPWLKKHWKREQEPSETPSRRIGNAEKRLQDAMEAGGSP